MQDSKGKMYKGRLKDGIFVAIRCLKMKKAARSSPRLLPQHFSSLLHSSPCSPCLYTRGGTNNTPLISSPVRSNCQKKKSICAWIFSRKWGPTQKFATSDGPKDRHQRILGLRRLPLKKEGCCLIKGEAES